MSTTEPVEVTAAPTVKSLAEQLTEADVVERPLAKRVDDLERQLRTAVDAADYTTAADLQHQLAKGRAEWEPAHAAKQAIIVEISRVNDTKAKEVQKAQAHQRHRDLQQEASQSLNEAKQEFAKLTPALLEARALVHRAVDAEKRAGQLRTDAWAALVSVGEADPRSIGDNGQSLSQIANYVNADPLMRTLYHGRL